MKLSIKTTIGIIIIAVSSISLAQAEQHRSDRGHDRSADRSHNRSYDKPRHERHYRHNERRHHWKRSGHRSNHYRAHRHSYGSYYRRHNGHKHYRGYRRIERHGYRPSTYRSPRVYSSHSIVVSGRGHSNNVLPVIAGGLIGSSIANHASHGDPAATFGGAVFGALVGNALTRH